MEERRPNSATTPARGTSGSGIPKPSSRLPLPRSSIPTAAAATTRAPGQHQKPSSDTSRAPVAQSPTVGSLRTPRLRSTASREHINPSATLPRSYKPGLPSTASHSRTSARDPASRNVNARPLQRQPPSPDSPFKNPLIPGRRPSGQFGYTAESSVVLTEDLSPEDGTEEDTPALPPLARPAAENLTFDALLADSRKPRPSLTERTIETLSNLPSSPAGKRRGSNFFDTLGSRRPVSKGSVASRPGSSYQSDGSNGPLSRPGSSSSSFDRTYSNFRASTNSYKPPLATVQGTPSRRLPTLGSSSTTTPNPKLRRGLRIAPP